MEVSALAELQRAEVELVLQSGVFSKAPRLERFFDYICSRQLAGLGDQVKEYSIAVEALGRTPDFDPKKDSIVRVEAHRLRKRLEEYYRGPGADHAIRIEIPNGQYRPLFVPAEKATTAGSEPEGKAREASASSLSGMELVQLLPDTHTPAPLGAALSPADFGPQPALSSGEKPIPSRMSPPWRHKRIWLSVMAAAVCCSFAGTALLLRHSHSASKLGMATPAAPAAPGEIWTAPATTPPIPGELRLLAGYHGVPLLDRQGYTWMADAYYRGGRSTPIPADRVMDPQADSPLVRAQRTGVFRYDIPLRRRSYELHLYVAETEYGPGNPRGGEAGSRLFGVSVNGRNILTAFDPLASAGAPNRVYERVFKDIYPAADGKLHLSFESDTGEAFLNALALLPSPPGRIRPIRIVAQSSPVMDSEGRLWIADKYFTGGRNVVRAKVISNSPEVLFQGERYGNFSYRIPLAPGKYRVTLYFAETWFGAESPEPAIGSRIFDVFANGRALLRNFQIALDAGGPNRGIEKVFNNLEPNGHGVLLLDFVPSRNYAEINALEVVETN